MKKRALLERIEQLERRVAALERDPFERTIQELAPKLDLQCTCPDGWLSTACPVHGLIGSGYISPDTGHIAQPTQ